MGTRIGRMKVCLNGGRDRGAHPAVPVTPAELAASAAAAVAAGAEAVHLHPRRASVADADRMAAAGPAIDWLRILVEIIDTPADTATAVADEVLRRLDELNMTAPRLLHGEQDSCWPLVAHAGRLGLATRIGLEDTTAGPAESAVGSNAELVQLALTIWTESAPGMRPESGRLPSRDGAGEIPGQRAEARGFEPRMGANPNRISSAAP